MLHDVNVLKLVGKDLKKRIRRFMYCCNGGRTIHTCYKLARYLLQRKEVNWIYKELKTHV